MVRTLRCGRSNPGSNPGHGSDIFSVIKKKCFFLTQRDFKFITSVSGIVVSIAAFQAVDPGSIPGHRNSLLQGLKYAKFHLKHCQKMIDKVALINNEKKRARV